MITFDNIFKFQVKKKIVGIITRITQCQINNIRKYAPAHLIYIYVT